jgi:hypothetical protein
MLEISLLKISLEKLVGQQLLKGANVTNLPITKVGVLVMDTLRK